MILLQPTELLHLLLKEAVSADDTVVDATVGNGYDTVFLAKLVGTKGKVLGLDIQECAISQAFERLNDEGLGRNAELHVACHSRLEAYVNGVELSAVVFNLGYLPGGNHRLTTKAETTLAAMTAAVHALKIGGVIGVVCYTGHVGGAEEGEAVKKHLLGFDCMRVADYRILDTRRPGPYLLFCAKMR